MESKAKLLGHPIHPMLIVFPLGLLITVVAFDIVGLSTGDASSGFEFRSGRSLLESLRAAFCRDRLSGLVGNPLRYASKSDWVLVRSWQRSGCALFIASWFLVGRFPKVRVSSALSRSFIAVTLALGHGMVGRRTRGPSGSGS